MIISLSTVGHLVCLTGQEHCIDLVDSLRVVCASTTKDCEKVPRRHCTFLERGEWSNSDIRRREPHSRWAPLSRQGVCETEHRGMPLALRQLFAANQV